MSDIADRMRRYIAIRGGPAKDADGKYIGTAWPMMLEASDEIERLRSALKDIYHQANEGQIRNMAWNAYQPSPSTITPELDAAIQDELDHPPKDIMK